MRGAIACVILAACGRIDFDARRDAGDSVTGDSGDATANACAPFDVTLDEPGPPTLQGLTAAMWVGDRYVIIIRRAGLWSVFDLSATGVAGPAFDSVVPGSESLNNQYPATAWSGTHVGLLSSDGTNIYFRSLDPSSNVVTGPMQVNVTAGAGSQGLAWTGDRYLAVWASGVNVYMRELSETGVPMTGELLESTTGGVIGSVATNASRYVACVTRTSDGSGAGVIVDRTSMAPTTVSFDVGTGTLCAIVRRPDDSFAATWVSPNTTKLQLINSDATLRGAGVAIPPVAGSHVQVPAPTAQGLRFITMTVPSYDVERFELDAAGAITAGPLPIATVPAVGPINVPNEVLGSGGRDLFTIAYDVSSDPYHLRLIQSCH